MSDRHSAFDATSIAERTRSLTNGHEAELLLVELETLRRRVEAGIAEVVATVAQRGLFRDDGCLSVASWLRKVVNLSSTEVRRIRRLAEFVGAHPGVAEHLRSGRLASAAAARLADLHANPRVRDQLPFFLDTLVHYAATLPFDDFDTVARRWEQLADADGAHRSHEVVHASRDAWVHSVGASTRLEAQWGNQQGAFVAEVFEKFVQAELAKDLERHDLGAGVSDLVRTGKQRRADALYAVFASAADRLPPSPEPLVNILIDQATYERTLAALEADSPLPSLIEPGEDVFTKRCETTAGVVLDPVAVVATSLVGHVRRVVVDAASVPIDLGRRSRLFSGGARAASQLQRRRCIWPGCSVLTCEVDHRVPWSQGGDTSVANADPLCRRHNRLKVHGYRSERSSDLPITRIVTPDGRILVPV